MYIYIYIYIILFTINSYLLYDLGPMTCSCFCSRQQLLCPYEMLVLPIMVQEKIQISLLYFRNWHHDIMDMANIVSFQKSPYLSKLDEIWRSYADFTCTISVLFIESSYSGVIKRPTNGGATRRKMSRTIGCNAIKVKPYSQVVWSARPLTRMVFL